MSQRRGGKRRVQEVSDDSDTGFVDHPPPSKNRRTRREANSDEEDAPARRPRKPRAADSDEEDDVVLQSDEDEDERPRKPAYRPQLERGEDGYIAGSIVRVKIVGFMTYDHVEFTPGPHLNMILGPNGTGKSSIAAAIAIGLGFAPKVMGRAPDVRSYVKQGTETAEIEIELKGRKRKRNPVIWRKFGRDSEKSEWRLNGQPTTKRAVQALIESFGVQADNLCSFLPQDKVADFAKMNSVTVLKETMRGAGDPHLLEWHEDLVENGKAARDVEHSLTSKTQKRDALRRQVEELEPDVRNYERRLDLQDQLRTAELELAAVKWKQGVGEVTERKHQLRKVKQKLINVETKQQPLSDLRDRREKMERNVKRDRDERESAMRQSMSHLSSIEKRHLAAIRESEQVESELGNITKQARERQKKIKGIETRIRQEEEVLNGPEEDKEAIRRELQEKKTAQKSLGTDRNTANTQLEKRRHERERIQHQLNEYHGRVEELTQQEKAQYDIEAQRRDAVFKRDYSIRYAVKWIEEHQDQLRDRVFYPAIISVNVPDKRYAAQIEGAMSAATAKSFICQNQEDYKTLLDLNNAPQVRLHIASVQVDNPPPPLVAADEMAAMGLDGFATDFIEAEPAVMTFLRQTAAFHQIGVSLKPHSQISSERAVRAGIRTWFSATHGSRVIQSRYGARHMQTTTFSLKRAEYMTFAVDQDKIKQIADEMAETRRQIRGVEQPLATAKDDVAQAQTKLDEVNAEIRDVMSGIQRLQAKMQKFDVARNNIQRFKKQLQMELDKPTPEQRRQELRDQVESLAKDSLKELKSYMTGMDRAYDQSKQVSMDAYKLSQATANVRAIHDASSKGQDRIEELTRELEDVAERYAAARDEKERLLDVVQNLINQFPRERRDDVRATATRINKSAADVEGEIHRLNSELDVSLNVDGNTVDRYNRLKGELEEKEEDVTRSEREFDALKAKITSVLDKFNPALDSLVEETSAKFSAAFARIGCTGEVRVSRVQGNYAEWGIEILVSYRDGQDLEVLTASRQSGGERSLATVTYLMSLSEMARTPFSLVDEINQGMDARAERSVHNQMVQVTCAGGENAGQYFLITPKLLTDLDYHENMRVLIVENGSWLPDSAVKNTGALATRLANYRRRIGA